MPYFPPAFIREKLTAARTYYVRTDGSDSNNGLANTSGGAFLTVQKAVNVVAADLDIGAYNVTIQVGTGTYAAAASVTSAWLGSGVVTILGDAATPSNVVFSGTGGVAATGSGSRIKVSGIRFTGGGSSLNAVNGGAIAISGACEFAGTSTDFTAQGGGSLIDAQFMSYTIATNKSRHCYALVGGLINIFDATVTVSGTPAFSTNFVDGQRLGIINAGSASFSGSATGTRYNASLLGLVNTAGGGASFFPGDVAGSTATGGIYA